MLIGLHYTYELTQSGPMFYPYLNTNVGMFVGRRLAPIMGQVRLSEIIFIFKFGSNSPDTDYNTFVEFINNMDHKDREFRIYGMNYNYETGIKIDWNFIRKNSKTLWDLVIKN